MTAHIAPLPVDLFDQALTAVRPLFKKPASARDQLTLLWAISKKARNLAAHDVACEALLKLGAEPKIACSRDDIAHVVDWGLRNLNPFETNPLQ